MNLKEAFRYQNFIDSNLRFAESYIRTPMYHLEETKYHKRSAANPEAEDFEEKLEPEQSYPIDKVIEFMVSMTEEKQKLTEAIGVAKASIEFDIDAAVAVNKCRQEMSQSIRVMMQSKPGSRTTSAYGYKFNAEGNQVSYKYDVEIVTKEAYNRDMAKKIMKEAISTADKVSAEIDAAKVNTVVDYAPPYDVNDSFEEIFESFMNRPGSECEDMEMN